MPLPLLNRRSDLALRKKSQDTLSGWGLPPTGSHFAFLSRSKGAPNQMRGEGVGRGAEFLVACVVPIVLTLRFDSIIWTGGGGGTARKKREGEAPRPTNKQSATLAAAARRLRKYANEQTVPLGDSRSSCPDQLAVANTIVLGRVHQSEA